LQAWNIQYTKQAERQLKRLSPDVETRIRSFMENRVAKLEAPQVIAKKLSGAYEDRIRYRVGDYRVICRIEDHLLLILVVEVAHRREVYR
jgi:mRNA interferase RelE/StbE